jgi:hypothetical protein
MRAIGGLYNARTAPGCGHIWLRQTSHNPVVIRHDIRGNMKQFIITLFLISSYPLYAFEGLIISDKGLYLRNAPTSNGKILTLMPKGSIVKIINPRQKKDTIAGQSGYWAKIEYNQLTGFAFDRYMTLNLPSNNSQDAPYCSYKFRNAVHSARLGPDFAHKEAGWPKNSECINEQTKKYETPHSNYSIKWCEVAIEGKDTSKTGWVVEDYNFSRNYDKEFQTLLKAISKIEKINYCLEFRSKEKLYSGDGDPVEILRTDAQLQFDFINKNIAIGYGYEKRIGKIVDIEFRDNRFFITFLDPYFDRPTTMDMVIEDEHIEIDFDIKMGSYVEIKGIYLPGIPISEL